MPCQDEGRQTTLSEIDPYHEVKTRLACEFCKLLESGDIPSSIPPWAKEWWKKHKEEDARRIAGLRTSGLRKLTEDEREALGIK